MFEEHIFLVIIWINCIFIGISISFCSPKLCELSQQKLIAYLYINNYGLLPPEEWGKGKDGLVAKIRNQLGIRCGNTNKVRNTMHKTYKNLKKQGKLKKGTVLTELDLGGINLQRIARPNTTQLKIPPGSKYEIMACKLIEEGGKERFVADLVSIEMLNDGLNTTVSRAAVKSMILRLNPIQNVVKTKGQWSDYHEGWVIARYNFTLHVLVRCDETHDHPSVKNHVSKFGPTPPDWLNRNLLEEKGYTFSKKQVAWYDECHVYQKVGPDSDIQYRFKWDNGTPIPNLTDDYDDLCPPSDVCIDISKYTYY